MLPLNPHQDHSLYSVFCLLCARGYFNSWSKNIILVFIQAIPIIAELVIQSSLAFRFPGAQVSTSPKWITTLFSEFTLKKVSKQADKQMSQRDFFGLFVCSLFHYPFAVLDFSQQKLTTKAISGDSESVSHWSINWYSQRYVVFLLLRHWWNDIVPPSGSWMDRFAFCWTTVEDFSLRNNLLCYCWIATVQSLETQDVDCHKIQLAGSRNACLPFINKGIEDTASRRAASFPSLRILAFQIESPSLKKTLGLAVALTGSLLGNMAENGFNSCIGQTVR